MIWMRVTFTRFSEFWLVARLVAGRGCVKKPGQSNFRMILPKCSLACIMRCAVGASAAGSAL